MKNNVIFFVLTAFTSVCLADEESCFKELTHKPFCVSKALSREFCKRLGSNPQILETAKQCIATINNANSCLGIPVTTNSPEDNVSDCE